MVLEYIRYTMDAHEPEALIAAYAEAGKSLRSAPECLGYDLTRCEENANSLILCIRWQSTDAHLEGFRKGPHFGPFLAAIRDFIPEITEMRHYAPTPVSWQRG